MTGPSDFPTGSDGCAVFGAPSVDWIDAFTPQPQPGTSSAMFVRTVELASIDVGSRLRALDPAWVDLLAEEIQRDGQIEPIRVVERGEGFVLIDGARRIAARLKLGHAGIEAKIEPEEVLADAAFVRLGEIKGNFLRGELTMLERAYYVAAWRGVYESVNALPKRGRKPRTEISVHRTNISDAANDDAADAFVLSLSEAAQKALQISSKTLYRYLQIAGIAPEQGHRLTGHPSADSRVELLILAEQTAVRQVQIIDLLVGDNRRLGTVAEAVAFLDGAPAAPTLTPPERFHQTFARLRQQDQEAFFDLNADAIARWNAARASKGGKRTRGAA